MICNNFFLYFPSKTPPRLRNPIFAMSRESAQCESPKIDSGFLKGRQSISGARKIHPKIANAVSKLKVGEVSDPVLVNDGYYIFKIIDKKIIDTQLVESDMKALKTDVLSKKLQIDIKSFLIDLRKKSFVEIDYTKLANVS
jgi:hypothetical protein